MADSYDEFRPATDEEISNVANSYYCMLHRYVQKHYEYCSDAGYSLYVKDDICLLALYHTIELVAGIPPDIITPYLIDWVVINTQMPKRTVEQLFFMTTNLIKYGLNEHPEDFPFITPALALKVARNGESLNHDELEMHLSAFVENLDYINEAIDQIDNKPENYRVKQNTVSPQRNQVKPKTTVPPRQRPNPKPTQKSFNSSHANRNVKRTIVTSKLKNLTERINFTWVLVVMCVSVGIFIAVMMSRPYDNSQHMVTPPLASSTPYIYTPPQVYINNGDILLSPSYKCVCPFTVSVLGDNGYYIYLKYRYAPSNSVVSREYTGGNESDIAFYVAPGSSVSIDVPIGVYKLYYAYGPTWRGAYYKFGEDTQYCSSNDLLEFYADSEYYNGVTLELWAQHGGNYSTKSIDEDEFP